MQVKKFEARTMKEALDLVKINLGPEAIILSAKENNRGFGLVGQNSVEVTAAISEAMLRKKKYAEAKLNSKAKETYIGSSAKLQKKFIDKAVNNHQKQPVKPRELTAVPYIQISENDDEQDTHPTSELDFVEPVRKVVSRSVEAASKAYGPPVEQTAAKRIKSAALDAFKAIQFITDDEEEEKKKAEASRKQAQNLESAEKEQKIQSLQNEIAQLKSLITKFQNVPQTFVSGHPGIEHGVSYELSFMYEKLLQIGISIPNAVEILSKTQQSLPLAQLKKKAFVKGWVAKYFLENIKTTDNWTGGRVHVFMGAGGQGKTTSLVKFASHLVIREKKKIAIVSCDTFKVGASEQLKIFSQILNVPFAKVRSQEEWAFINERLKNVDHILIDMPGKFLKTPHEADRLKKLIPVSDSRAIHYVQSVLTKDSDAVDMARKYKSIGFDDVIFTRLDESSQYGMIYNFQKEFGVPLHSFGIGTQVPEDFEQATKERVVDLFFNLSQLRKEK